MLIFRPCILAGAFETPEEQLAVIDFIWELKYKEAPDNRCALPKSSVKIGLEYDQEDYFYAYLLRLREQIQNLQCEADTSLQNDNNT